MARGSGQFVQLGYKMQERCGIMPDILKRPVLTLYTDLRWAHQSLVAEIISMSSVLVAILLEFMTNQCDSETGLVSEEIGSKNVYPVLTNEFSCAQTVSLIVSDFIVLVVMVAVGLVVIVFCIRVGVNVHGIVAVAVISLSKALFLMLMLLYSLLLFLPTLLLLCFSCDVGTNLLL